MDNISFEKLEELCYKENNIKWLIKKIEKEIDNDKKLKIKINYDNSINREISNLELYKSFLDNYPIYFKNGLKKLFINIIYLFLTTGLFFLFIFISIGIYYLTRISIINLIKMIFVCSISTSFYFGVIWPIISNYKFKKEILNKFGDQEMLEIKLESLRVQKRKMEKAILEIDVKIKLKEIKLIALQKKLTFIEEEKNIQRHKMLDFINDFFFEIKKEPIYSDEDFILKRKY